MASAFLAGAISVGLIGWWMHSEEIALLHGFAKKAGIMRVDPTGVDYWTDSIAGARGTRGHTVAQR